MTAETWQGLAARLESLRREAGWTRIGLTLLRLRAMLGGATVDAEETSGDQWITVNGAAVLIGEDGQVKAGAGGNLTDRKPGGETSPVRENVEAWPQEKRNAVSENNHKNAKTKMSKAESASFNAYSDENGERRINGALRGGRDPDAATMKTIRAMDDVFKRAKTKEEMTVFRGVGEGNASEILKCYEEGRPFVDKGYTSTSTFHHVAKRFATGENKTVMHIKLPKGAKAMSIRDSAVDKSEHEILIARKSAYKITGVDKSAPGKTVIYAEYLPQ